MAATSSITAVVAIVLAATSVGCVRMMCGPPSARAMSSMSSRTEAVASFEAVAPPNGARCEKPVPLVSADAKPTRPYRVLSRETATCDKVSPKDCDHTLQARACELGADAIVLEDHDDSSPRRRFLGGALVRWEP